MFYGDGGKIPGMIKMSMSQQQIVDFVDIFFRGFQVRFIAGQACVKGVDNYFQVPVGDMVVCGAVPMEQDFFLGAHIISHCVNRIINGIQASL